MRKFRGSFEGLQELVAITGIDGGWIERQQLKQYRADSGAILNFWASTGTVNFQGPEQAAQELEAAVFRSALCREGITREKQVAFAAWESGTISSDFHRYF